MNTKTVSEKALATIDHYLNFRFNDAMTSVPYYNNNRASMRGGLRGMVGKGSPRDIFDEVEIAMAKEKGSAESGAIKDGSFIPNAITADSLKHFLVDHNLGIDCSGFIFHVLNTESESRGKGTLERRIVFPFSKGLLRIFRTKIRPVENIDVATLAHEKNSRAINLKDVEPSDIITMTGSNEDTSSSSGKERDHILLIYQVDYQNFIPMTLYYVHSMAWPSDGMYGHGVRQGKIEITDIDKPLTEQKWTEAGKTGAENYTWTRSTKARTEIRRMLSL